MKQMLLVPCSNALYRIGAPHAQLLWSLLLRVPSCPTLGSHASSYWAKTQYRQKKKKKGIKSRSSCLKKDQFHSTLHILELLIGSSWNQIPTKVMPFLRFLSLLLEASYSPLLLRASSDKSLSQKYPPGLWAWGTWPKTHGSTHPNDTEPSELPFSFTPLHHYYPLARGTKEMQGRSTLRRVWAERMPSSVY